MCCSQHIRPAAGRGLEARTLTISRTKDEVKDAPDYDELRSNTAEYRNDVDSYWGQWPMM